MIASMNGGTSLVRRLTDLTAKIVGAGVGAIAATAIPETGAMVTILVGAGAAGAVELLANVGTDLAERKLSERERRRTNMGIQEALREWTLLSVEPDPRFALRPELADPASGNTDAMRAIIECALIAVQGAYEERRARHLARFFARWAFMPHVDAAQAHHLLKTAESLTFRQMCLLYLFDEHAATRFSNVWPRKLKEFEPDPALASLLAEGLVLDSQGLVYRNDHTVLLGPEDLIPGRMRRTPLGEHAAQLLALDRLERNDLAPVLATLDTFPRS